MTASRDEIADDITNAYRAYATAKATPSPVVQAQLKRIHAACTRGAKWGPRNVPRGKRSHPELGEQLVLAEWLDIRVGEYGWIHVPNEGRRTWRTGASLKAQGLKAGVPDVLIFKRPPLDPAAHGVALELKRPGATYSAVSPQQRAWLRSFLHLGWLAAWKAGADEATAWLTKLGY